METRKKVEKNTDLSLWAWIETTFAICAQSYQKKNK